MLTQWDTADFRCWNAFTGKFLPLFQMAMKEEYVICVPPDYSIPREGITESFLKWHLLIPSKKYVNTFTSVNGKGNAGVERSGPNDELLKKTGTWPAGCFSVPCILSVDQIVNAAGHSISIFILDRSLVSGDDTTPCVSVFGLRHHRIQEAVDYLSLLDPNHGILSSLANEVSFFRNSYHVMEGYEEDFFERIEDAVDRHVNEVMPFLNSTAVSVRRQLSSATLAIESYIHSQLYQQTIPLIIAKTIYNDEKVASLCARNIDPKEVGVTDQLKTIDLAPVGDAIDMINLGTNPFDKLQYVSELMDAVTNCVPEEQRKRLCADEILPLMSYALLLHPCRNLCAHLEYLKRFRSAAIDDGSELEYALVSFQATVEYLANDTALHSVPTTTTTTVPATAAANNNLLSPQPRRGPSVQQYTTSAKRMSRSTSRVGGSIQFASSLPSPTRLLLQRQGAGEALGEAEPPLGSTAPEDVPFDEDEFEKMKERRRQMRAAAKKVKTPT